MLDHECADPQDLLAKVQDQAEQIVCLLSTQISDILAWIGMAAALHQLIYHLCGDASKVGGSK